MNSQLFGSNLPDEAEQSEWLREELARPSEHLRVLFSHVPAYSKGPEDDFSDGSEQMCLKPAAREPLLGILDCSPPNLMVTAHTHRFWVNNQPKWDWLGVPATALGQNEMVNVPSHNLPPGDDRVGWTELRRKKAGWTARVHYCGLP